MRALVRACGWCVLGVVLFAVSLSLFAPSRTVVIGSPSLSSSPVTVVPFPASSVLGGPSLSAAFVDRVLATYRSPAVGLGQALFADSQQFGIDDVDALAFFWHESGFGRLGVARWTRSLGNIRCAGYPTCLHGYRSYGSWQAGAWDWFRLLRYEYLPRGLSTVESIVPVYAPASDHNDVGAYIAAVLHAVAIWRAGRVQV